MQIEIKAGHVEPNQTYLRSNGTEYIMLSDPSGSTKSKHIKTGQISYPNFDEKVLIEDEKQTFKIVKVNLQEGLFLDDEIVIGGYSHHNKVIVFTDYIPAYMGMIPNNFSGYEVITHRSDSVGLTFWTHDGEKSFYDLKTKETA